MKDISIAPIWILFASNIGNVFLKPWAVLPWVKPLIGFFVWLTNLKSSLTLVKSSPNLDGLWTLRKEILSLFTNWSCKTPCFYIFIIW